MWNICFGGVKIFLSLTSTCVGRHRSWWHLLQLRHRNIHDTPRRFDLFIHISAISIMKWSNPVYYEINQTWTAEEQKPPPTHHLFPSLFINHICIQINGSKYIQRSLSLLCCFSVQAGWCLRLHHHQVLSFTFVLFFSFTLLYFTFIRNGNYFAAFGTRTSRNNEWWFVSSDNNLSRGGQIVTIYQVLYQYIS